MKRTRCSMFGLVCALVMGCVPQEAQRPTAAPTQSFSQPCFGAWADQLVRPDTRCTSDLVWRISQLARNMQLEPYNEKEAANQFVQYIWGMQDMLACKNTVRFPSNVTDQLWLAYQRYLTHTNSKPHECQRELLVLLSLVERMAK